MSINNLQQTSQGRIFDVCIYALCVLTCVIVIYARYVLISLKFSCIGWNYGGRFYSEALLLSRPQHVIYTSLICNLQRIKKLLEIGDMATSFIGIIRVWWHKGHTFAKLATKKMVASLYNSTNLFKMRN